MAFDISGWNSISRSTKAPKPVWLTYVSDDDTVGTISASGYFNAMADYIDEDDLLYVEGSDGTGLLRFTSANGVTPVTMTAFVNIATGSITDASIAANAGIVPSKFTTAFGYQVECIPVSFIAGTQTTHVLNFPNAVIVTRIRAFVTAPLTGADDGFIVGSNSVTGAMANGTIDIPASSIVGTEASTVPTLHNIFAAGTSLRLAIAKDTPGGLANVYVEYYITG
jgi:hypothetical protein